MNRFFLYFLTLISSFLLFHKDYWIIAILFMMFVIYSLYKGRKNNKKIIIGVIGIFIIGIFRYLLGNIRLKYDDTFFGIVVLKNDNYLLLFNGLETFYINSKETLIDELDIVVFKGKLGEISFSTLESGFDFEKYLLNKGVERQIYYSEYKMVCNFPINFNIIKNSALSLISGEDAKALIGGILFSSLPSSSNVSYLFKSINMVVLLSFSGIYINYLIRIIQNLLSYKFTEKKTDYLTLLIISPLLLLNITSLVFWRVLLMFMVRVSNTHFFDGQIEKLTQISLVGTLFLLINPYNLFQKSFYISFLISLFFCFSSLYLLKYKRWKRRIMSLFLIFMIILPFNVSSSNSLNIIGSVISFLMMLVFKPLFLICLPLLIGIKIPFLENIISFIVERVSLIDIYVFNINIPKIGLIGYVLYFSMLIIILFFAEINLNRPVKNIVIVSICAFSLYALPIQNYCTMEVSFINVGQGDSTMIRYKDKTVLIDTGGLTYSDLALNNLIPYLRSKRLYKIDDLIITHKDYDHYGAANSLIKYFKVKNLHDYNSTFPITIGPLKFENLNNYTSLFEEENDKSLVLSLNYENKDFLFMGDAPIKIERAILKDNPSLKCDILKVGHHGSDTSTCEEFIKQVKPKEAVISCGYKNKFHHPHDTVINLLNKYEINIRRTDLEGTIMYKFYV